MYDSLKAIVAKLELFVPHILLDELMYFLTTPKIKTKMKWLGLKDLD